MSEPFTTVTTIIGVKFGNAIAGALGGFATYIIDPKLHVRDGFILVAIGGLFAFYLAPFIQHHFLFSESTTTFISFLSGSIARALILLIKERYPILIIRKGEDLIK